MTISRSSRMRATCRSKVQNMAKIYKYTVPLAPVTKKNSPQIFYMGARCPVCNKGKTASVMPSAAYLKYERAAVYYLTPKPKKPIDTPCRVETRFYMPTRRRCYLANHIEAIHDILVEAKILADDDYTIIASVDGSRVMYDKENPRTEIFIEELEV